MSPIFNFKSLQKPQKLTIWKRLQNFFKRFQAYQREGGSVPMLVGETGSVFSGTTLSSDMELKSKDEEAQPVEDDNEDDEDELDTIEAPVYDDDALDDLFLDLRTKRNDMSMKEDVAALKIMMQEIQKKIN
jgi:hypothetical protein